MSLFGRIARKCNPIEIHENSAKTKSQSQSTLNETKPIVKYTLEDQSPNTRHNQTIDRNEQTSQKVLNELRTENKL